MASPVTGASGACGKTAPAATSAVSLQGTRRRVSQPAALAHVETVRALSGTPRDRARADGRPRAGTRSGRGVRAASLPAEGAVTGGSGPTGQPRVGRGMDASSRVGGRVLCRAHRDVRAL